MTEDSLITVFLLMIAFAISLGLFISLTSLIMAVSFHYIDRLLDKLASEE